MNITYATYSLKREVVRQIISRDNESLPIVEVRFLINSKPFDCRQVSLGPLLVKPLVISELNEEAFCLEQMDGSLNKLIDNPETRTFFIRVQDTVNATRLQKLYREQRDVSTPTPEDGQAIVDFEQRVGKAVDNFIEVIKEIGLL